MPLNISSAWGDPYSDWKTAQSSSLGSYFQFFNSTSGVTWDWLRSHGYQSINQESLDYTIAPWRISKDSALVDISGYYWYNDYQSNPDEPLTSDRYNAHINGFSMLEEKYNVPFILNLKGSVNNGAPWTGYYGYYFDDGHTAVRLNNSYPVVNFRYDKIKVLPTFWFTATDISRAAVSPSTITQYGGIPDFATIENTPYCVGVGFRIYIDKAGTWTEVALTPAIDTHFTGNDTPSDITGWFCLDGMKILREPYSSNKSGTHYNNWFYGQSVSYNLTWEGSPTGGWTHGDAIAKASSFRRPESAWSNSISIGRANIVSGTVSRFDDLSERLDGTANDGGTAVVAFHFAKIDSDNYDIWVEDVKKQLAYIGLPFILTNAYLTDDFDSDNVYLPVFDSQRCTTGTFKHGAENSSLINYNWRWIYELDPLPEDIPPTPPEPPAEDSGYLTNRGLYTNRFSNPSYTVWAFYGTSLGNNGLDAAIAAINNLYITDPDGNEKWTLDFKGSNPSDYIVGLYAYPLAFKTSENSYTFTLGAVSFDTINVKHYADDGYISFGSINLTYNSSDVTWYGDFRDYPPYSTAELYIPFCGTVDIDLAFFIGHSMYIDMYYDIYTGACSAAIYRDNITLYKVVNGQIGVQLPLTSLRAGDYQNNIHALENALKQNEMRLATSALTLGLSAGAAVATGGASLAVGAGVVTGSAGLLSTMQERDNIEYKLSHTHPKIAQTGASETQNGYRVGGIYPILFIKRAVMLDSYNADKYSKTVGFACCINTLLGSMSGLTVCSKIDTDGIAKTVDGITISPTADEINAIKQAAANGIIL